MNIVMVSYMDFTGPGVMHMFHFANGLVRRGHNVLFLVNGRADSVRTMEEKPLFAIREIAFDGLALHKKVLRDVERFHPHIVHVWTPRNVPARVGLELKYRFQTRLIIHYEDDEDDIFRRNESDYFRFLTFGLDTLHHPEKWVWVHPYTYHWVNVYADALTVISAEYARHLHERWQIPAWLLMPGVDLTRFTPSLLPDEALIRRHHLEGRRILVYGGSIASFYEFDTILEAIRLIHDRHPDVLVMQYGRNFMQQTIDSFLKEHRLTDNFLFLGLIAHHDVTRYLSLGEIMLQPGQNTIFNRHRLPSKIPEYMAMGKPVITFSCGIGEQFTHLDHVWKLTEGTPEELANALNTLLDNEELRRTLSYGARRRAEELFSWDRSVERLISFYQAVMLDPRKISIDECFPQKQAQSEEIARMIASAGPRDDMTVVDIKASSVWEELIFLRNFHRKVTRTCAYKIYFNLKRAIHSLRRSIQHDTNSDSRR